MLTLNTTCVTTAPTKIRGNKWIGFGPTPPPDYGCKESYNYVQSTQPQKALKGSSSNSSSSGGLLTYHRYGECPSWYGPGKMCSLDIQVRCCSCYCASLSLHVLLQHCITRAASHCINVMLQCLGLLSLTLGHYVWQLLSSDDVTLCYLPMWQYYTVSHMLSKNLCSRTLATVWHDVNLLLLSQIAIAGAQSGFLRCSA